MNNSIPINDGKAYHGLQKGGFHIHSSDWKTSKPHGHQFLEFAFVARGAIDHHINGRTDRIETGGYYIVDHGIVHSMEQISDEPLWIVNFLFLPEFLDFTLVGKENFEQILNCYLLKFSYKTLKESITGKPFMDDDGSIRQIVNEIIHEYEQENYGYLECIRCLFVKLLILTMRKIGKKDTDAKQSEFIQKTERYIKLHYKDPIRLYHIGQELGYSVAYISSCFSDQMGMTFSQYLQQTRIEQAGRLLQTTELPISQISQEVGFSDIKFFGKIFKKYLGLSPREYRKRYKQIDFT